MTERQGYERLEALQAVDLLRTARLLHYSRPDGAYGGECAHCRGHLTGANGTDPVCEDGCPPDDVRAGLEDAAMHELVKSAAAVKAAPWAPGHADQGARVPQTGGAFVLDVPDNVPAVWGSGDDVLWASGEPLMLCGPQGVGKTTLAQQLALARAGVLEPTLLGFPVEPDERLVLYIAADRPAQAARSMRRMVTEDNRDRLDSNLLAWRGPLPFTVVDDPRRFAEWLTGLGVGTVVIDSLKDFAVGLTEDAIGAAVNIALQEVVACEIEVVDLHHQRKGQDGRKPRSLEDVYGSTWLTAGHGSVVLVWGEAGDPCVTLTHLKQPASEVGPLDVQHDHDHGRTTLPGAVDLLDLAASGVTVLEAAQAIYDNGNPDRNKRERARRRLDKLATAGRVRLVPGEGSNPGTYWLASVTLREGSRDPLTDPVTQGHDLALEAVTHPLTEGFESNGTPLRGAEQGERDTADLQARADHLEARHAEAAA